MSQISSQDPYWVSVPIAKYSHNTSPYSTRRFVWNHVGVRNDLDFIVRDTRVIDENGNYANRIVMKITAGADVLVCVTLKHPNTVLTLAGIARSWRARQDLS